MNVQTIARLCHAANRELQLIQADPGIPVAPVWEDISEEMRRSIVEGVFGVLAGNTPEVSHEGWCRFKREHGWVYGPVKDEDAKTHPCLVPYDELPESQKVKDHLFVAIVLALSSQLNIAPEDADALAAELEEFKAMSDEEREAYDRARAEWKDSRA